MDSKTMKAYARVHPSDDRIELIDVAIPEIGNDEVLVHVQAFGVGVQDRYFIPPNAHFPFVIGSEAAGIIAKVGSDVSDFQAGDRVILVSSMQSKGGCWAEYAAVSSQIIAPLPDKLDFVHGAAIPVPGKAAVECMRTLDLTAGDTLFIAGASGAIGTFVIQFARNQGICVVGSASSTNHQHMLALGAGRAVDYADPDWKQQILRWKPGGVDAALAIQPGTGSDCLDIVRDGGKVVTVSGDSASVDPQRSISVEQFQHQLDVSSTIVKLAQDIALGKLDLVIERVYPFEQATDALQKTETRHARGKVVVSVTET